MKKGSKIIEIRKSTAIVDRPVDEASIIVSGTRKTIGSYYTKQWTVGTGLQREELNYLLPKYVEVAPSDLTFNRKVGEYFSNFEVSVPDDGIVLEIGMTGDNSKPAGTVIKGNKGEQDFVNEPLNEIHYMQYKFAKESPKVAMSHQEALATPTKWFYIVDLEEEEKQKEIELQIKTTADANYYSINTDDQRIKQLLVLLGEDVIDINNINKVSRATRLKGIVDNDPERFNEAFKDEKAEIKFFIQQCLTYEVFEEIGSNIIEKNGSRVIGVNKEDACLFLMNPANEDVYSKLRLQLKNKLK